MMKQPWNTPRLRLLEDVEPEGGFSPFFFEATTPIGSLS